MFWMLLVGLGAAIVLIGILLGVADAAGAFKHRHASTSATVIAAVAIAAVGVVGQVLAKRMERPLDGSSPDALAQSYRTRFFLWIGFGEFPTFVGILALVITGKWVLYPVGALFAFVTYARIAPTREHLDRDDAALRHAGSALSVRTVLDGASTGPIST
jgi:hypothetical protein